MGDLLRRKSLRSVQEIRSLKRQLSRVDAYKTKIGIKQSNFEELDGNRGGKGVGRGVQVVVKEAEVDLLEEFVQGVIRHAVQKSLKWNDDNIKQTILLFSKTAPLADALECQFGHCQTFSESVKPWHFHMLVTATNKERPNTYLYDQLLVMYTLVMKSFYAVYWRKPLENKPCFYTANCEFQDPFYRQNVRHRNLEDEEIDALYFNEDFNLKEFVLESLKVFFPHEAAIWAKDQHEANIYALRIFVEMFEFGLWTKKEIDYLNEVLHTLVLSMTVYDRFLNRNLLREQVDSAVLEKYLSNLVLIKRLVGQAYIHIILLMLDEHVEGTLEQYGIEQGQLEKRLKLHGERVDLDDLFKYKEVKNKMFHTYFGFAISTYLMKPTGLGNKLTQNPGLFSMQKKVLGFLTEPSLDFYYHSLQTIVPHNLAFYLSSQDSQAIQSAKDFQRRINEFFRLLDAEEITGLEEKLTRGLGMLLDDISGVFNQFKTDPGTATAYQTALTMFGIPKDLLYILYYLVSYEAHHSDARFIIRKCAHVLTEIISRNTLAMSTLIYGTSVVHLQKYMAHDMIGGIVILSELFLSEFGILLADVSDRLYAYCLECYTHLSNKLVASLSGGYQSVVSGMIFQEFSAFICFHKLFKGIFKYKKSHKLKLEILYMGVDAENSKSFIKFFTNRKVPDNFRHRSPAELETEFAKALSWSDISSDSLREYIIDTAVHEAITTFKHAIDNFHYEDIQRGFHTFFTVECPLSDFYQLMETAQGSAIFKNVIRLYNEFIVFNRNSTFYHSTFTRQHGDVYTGTYITKSELEFKVMDDIEELFNKIKPAHHRFIPAERRKVYIDVYLPLYFKFLAGFLTLAKDKVIEMIAKDKLKRIREFFENQTVFLKEMAEVVPSDAARAPPKPQYQTFLEELHSKGEGFLFKPSPRKKIRELRNICTNSMICFLELVELYPYTSKETDELVRSMVWDKSSELTANLYRKLDLHAKYRLKHSLTDKKPLEWEDAEKEFLETQRARPRGQFDEAGLNAYQLESPWLFSAKQMQLTLETDAKTVEHRLSPPGYTTASLVAIHYLTSRYKSYRGFLVDNFEKNKALYVINIQDAHTQNVQNIVSFFFMKFAELDVNFKNLKNNFFVENFFKYLMYFLDAMMQNGSLFREKLYEFSQNEDYKEVVEHAFRKIWRLNKALFNYLVYKSFLDETWTGLYRDFYLISNFLQNLCEENFVPFKDWFREIRLDIRKKVPALEEFYGDIENALINNEIFASNDHSLAVQDREEMFPILCRAIELLTEFINGGLCISAERLYFKRMDVFVGMFFRVVDDLDSFFYELKDNVIVYINALIERDNPSVIEFVARNFSVPRIFTLLRNLVKKLYTKQRLKLHPELRGAFGWKGEDQPITDEMEAMEDIPNPEVLLEYYKLYEEDFAEHQLIGICIKLFVFVNNVAKHVSRYSHFVEEIEHNSHILNTLSYNSSVVLTQRESAIVWRFLNMITVKLEIQWPAEQADDGASASTDDADNNGRLENYIFQKKSISFFLNKYMKKDFLKQVNINSREEKHADFYSVFEDYDNKTNRLMNYYRNNRFLFYFNNPGLQRTFRSILMTITALINLFLLLFYNGLTEDYRRSGFPDGKILIVVFSVIGVVAAGTFLVLWVVTNYENNVEDTFIKFRKERLITKNQISLWQRVQIYFLKPILFHPDFLFYALKLALYLLGWLLNPIFFSLALFLIISMSETIKGVTLCFIHNGSKLGIGIMLIMICVNFFAFIEFDHFPNDFVMNPVNAGMCSTYFKCFLNVMNQGLINDQGIANVMIHVADSANRHFIGRFIHDVFYFIFITILLCDIIFGMVVDSYEEFKQDLRDRENDAKNICFVCGLHKEKIERYNLNFHDHRRHHDKWDYFYYYQFLKRFPSNDYKGVDIFVSEQLNKGQLTWLPNLRTQAIDVLEHFGNMKAI